MDSCTFLTITEQYSYSCMIALAILMLVWILFMTTRQYYGDYKINKLTFMPMKVASVGICADIIYIICFFIIRCNTPPCNTTSCNTPPCNTTSCDTNQDDYIALKFVGIAALNMSNIFYFFFIASIVREWRAYWHIIFFQSKVPLEQLDVKR